MQCYRRDQSPTPKPPQHALPRESYYLEVNMHVLLLFNTYTLGSHKLCAIMRFQIYMCGIHTLLHLSFLLNITFLQFHLFIFATNSYRVSTINQTTFGVLKLKKKKGQRQNPYSMRRTIKKISKIYTLIYMKHCIYEKYTKAVVSAKENI